MELNETTEKNRTCIGPEFIDLKSDVVNRYMALSRWFATKKEQVGKDANDLTISITKQMFYSYFKIDMLELKKCYYELDRLMHKRRSLKKRGINTFGVAGISQFRYKMLETFEYIHKYFKKPENYETISLFVIKRYQKSIRMDENELIGNVTEFVEDEGVTLSGGIFKKYTRVKPQHQKRLSKKIHRTKERVIKQYKSIRRNNKLK